MCLLAWMLRPQIEFQRPIMAKPQEKEKELTDPKRQTCVKQVWWLDLFSRGFTPQNGGRSWFAETTQDVNVPRYRQPRGTERGCWTRASFERCKP